MELKDAIDFLDQKAPDPKQGLPDEVFYFISRMTPLPNVDLLIQDEKGRTLLAWRDDQHAGTGWHVPGGIVRFKEKLETRIKKVAENEIGRRVEFNPVPIAVTEMIIKRDVRGHFIALLYKCFMPGSFVPDNGKLTEKDPGFLRWHEGCPENILRCHAVYKKFM
jgi:ADP-ribose pyrophosphatase YjhB (NUDIX family)